VGAAAAGLPNGVVFRREDFAGITHGRVNNIGQIVFQTQVSGPGVNSSNDQGYWIDDGLGGQTLLIRERDQAPGLPTGVTLTPGVAGFNDAGQTVVRGVLQGPGVNANNNLAVWSNAAGQGLQLLARKGDHAPGTPLDVLFDFISSSSEFNNAGQYAFQSSLRGASIDNENRSGIWSQGGGNGLQLVIREGDPAPGIADGAVFDDSRSEMLGFPELPSITFNMSLNDAGQLAFDGSLRGAGVTSANNRGIWAQDRSGTLHLIARAGDVLDVDDGTDVDMRTIQRFELGENFFNDRGQIAFRAVFTDGSSGIFVSNLVAVPEPYAVLLAAFGLLTMIGSRRPRSSALSLGTVSWNRASPH
jgi:hypothetical protein